MTQNFPADPPRLADPDGFYQRLIELHENLDVEQSMRLNARLILLLAQQIGDDAVLAGLLATAANA